MSAEIRLVDCPVCGGDGWFMEGPDERPAQRCYRCDGGGQCEVEFEPVEMEDLDAMSGTGGEQEFPTGPDGEKSRGEKA